MMNGLVQFFKHKNTRIWFIVTCVVLAVLLTLTIVSSTVLYQLISIKFGGEVTRGRGDDRYFDITAESKEDAYARGNALNEKICEEGFVLMKNEKVDGASALPLSSSEKKISVFGKNSVNLVYGGTGSGGGKYTDATTIFDSLEAGGFSVNPTLKAFYKDNGKSGEGRTPNPKIENSGNVVLTSGETPMSSYTDDVKNSYSGYNDAALIVISRIGGEGFDLPRTMADSDKHYLELDKNELDLIKSVTEASFGKVIVVLNTNSSLEMGVIENNPGIDACIYVGGAGYTGINALGKILNGSVTPSGKTVDTWAADFSADPTWQNFGNNLTDNGASYLDENGKDTKYYFVDYEESIYVGYRYYETRGAQNEDWYQSSVVYPFGYGLSYTDFSWEIVGESNAITLSEANKNDDIEIKVKVTNIGEKSGKDVVQLYCVAPSGKLEQPAVVLSGFAKTSELEPLSQNGGKNSSEILTIKFNPYYAASYDSGDSDDNGIKGYQLTGGDYSLQLRSDSHTVKEGVAPVVITVPEQGIAFDKDPVTGTVVENKFADAVEGLDTVLSSADWEGTWPTKPNGHNLADYSFDKKDLSSIAHNNPKTDWKMPITDVDVTVKAVELKGVDYGDEQRWDALLNSLSFTDMKELFNNGAFKTNGVTKIGLPATISSDGPVGFTNFMSEVDIYGTVSYASQYVMGCTWNTDLVKQMGESVGEEAAYGKQNVDPYVPYSGWYAPGLNLHRSPFGGRNFEYFSEDPYLTGKLASAEISGAKSKGLVTYMKHFALNEQETHRDENGICTWADERSIRELYLRPFEIAVKEGGANGIMTSFNRIGIKWTGGDYRLITEVLREEWGFKGTVICDFNVSPYMNAKQMVYAGGDLNLTTTRPWFSPDETSASDVFVLRRAAHNILYTVVNSNAMNGIDKNTVFTTMLPIWQIILIIVDCAAFVGLTVWGVFAIISLRKGTKKE